MPAFTGRGREYGSPLLPRFDLHTHSHCSDGHYAPEALIRLAHQAGVNTLALTDHDTVDGLPAAARAAAAVGLNFIAGLELSVTWSQRTVHIVGLGIDPEHPQLGRLLAELSCLREARALDIDRQLDRCGISGVLAEARTLAVGGVVTRTHFARILVARGHALEVRDVFKRYLTVGKPGYVSTAWVSLARAVETIHAAGGQAVIAHPLRYRWTRSWLRRLANEFRALGGDGIEVISGHPAPAEIRSLAAFAREFGLLGSLGSDFHGPASAWPKLGALPPWPEDLEPVCAAHWDAA